MSEVTPAEATPQCPACGAPADTRRGRLCCRRCGLPFYTANRTDQLPAALNTDGIIRLGVKCIGCEYDLRGLRLDGRCPECGKPVTETLPPDLLCHARPEYVRKLVWGNRLTILTIMANLLLTIAFAVYISSGRVAADVATDGLFFAVGGMVLFGAWILAVGAGIAGLFLLTANNPDRPGLPSAAAREILRWLPLAAIAITITETGLRAVMPPDAIPRIIAEITTAVTLACGYLVCRSYFGLLAQLASWLPDRKLVKRTRRYRRDLTLAFGVLFVLTLLNIIGGLVGYPIYLESMMGIENDIHQAIAVIALACRAITSLVILAGFIGTLVIQLNFQGPLKQQLRHALKRAGSGGTSE
jgi:endogenous inhibitor of DNA gyrase (YacG/DUF329 family)